MALISPGVEVTVIDESQYTPTAVGTVAYVLVASAQDKVNPSGTTAAGTTTANAEKLVTVTSQRELVSLFGTPTFQVDASDNPIHAHELNEYGLLAAYSALGVANRVVIQRANVDLAQLAGTTIRPTGTPSDGLYWLDLANTNWGIYAWIRESNVFDADIAAGEDILVVTDPDLIDTNGAPVDSVGPIDTYAIVPRNGTDGVFRQYVYYKSSDNLWTLVGTDEWMDAHPTVIATASPSLAQDEQLVINGEPVKIRSATPTIDTLADDINFVAINGVRASVNAAGLLEIRITSESSSVGNTTVGNGQLSITLGNVYGTGANVDCAAKLGLFQSSGIASDGGNTYTYYGPAVTFADYRNAPAWRTTDQVSRPSGSVWFKTSSTGNGANWGIKEYSALTDSWLLQSAPLYESDTAAIQNLDPTGGGVGIAAGTIYVKYNTLADGTGTFKPYIKNTAGVLKITGTTPASPFAFSAGNQFRMEVSLPGQTITESAVITVSGTGNAVPASTLVADILSANLTNITAVVETSGAISVTHLAGGTIKFTPISGSPSPVVEAGLVNDSKVQTLYAANGITVTGYLASPFTPLTYTYSTTEPFSNPVDGTLWYYNTPLEVDVLINDGTASWKGYRSSTIDGGSGKDARGYDLTATDPNGPILSASQPAKQSDGSTNVVAGDLWIDTGDLDNYPVIRRYNGASWELIDNTDQVGIDGIVFADARWGYNDTIDPIVDDVPAIADLITNDYVDSDCPDPRLYARGTLLFNTRRSGYGVKRFESEWFANDTVPPATLSTWVSHSGVDDNGVPYFGNKAQRNVVVEAMKAAIESSTALREEQTQFNLITCPGYPELIQNMITLNNDRKNTAFIIGDSPLTLNSSSQAITTWASNSNLAPNNGENGLVSRSEYLGVFYPAGLGTDLGGESVVVPASHMMLRTFIRSDNQSYQWFAPAGVRRGLIDNVSSIGYVDVTDNNLFRSIGVTAGLRDILYENDVNPLTVLPGVGLVAYGQKTRAAQNSAMDRINVARLVCYLRLVLDSVARPYIFEPNDTITRNQVKNAFESVLNDVVAKRGIYDYLVVCDTSNNTPDRIDRNELYVDIAIEPVKAIEFIYIPVRLKNTGDIAAGL